MTDITDIKTLKDAKMIVEICEQWKNYKCKKLIPNLEKRLVTYEMKIRIQSFTKLEFFQYALGSDWEDLTHEKLRRIEDKAYRIVEKWDDSIQERLRKGENNE